MTEPSPMPVCVTIVVEPFATSAINMVMQKSGGRPQLSPQQLMGCQASPSPELAHRPTLAGEAAISLNTPAAAARCTAMPKKSIA
jgi:hypothetical protein